MKKLLLLSLVMVCTASVAFAQLGSMGVFTDGTNPGQDCYIFEQTAPVFANAGLAIIHDNHGGAKSIQFAAPIPNCHSGETVNTTLLAGSVPVGDINTGLALGYGGCIAAPIVVATRQWGLAANSSQCCEWTLQGDPGAASGTIEGATCLDVLVTNIQGTSGLVVVGGADPVSTCGACEVAVPTKPATWGAVKELYKDI